MSHPDIKKILNSDASKQAKIKQLKELLEDQLAVRNASEEGMVSDADKPQLPDIINALKSLGVHIDSSGHSAGKHGAPKTD